MSYDRHLNAQIIDRCWSIYSLLTTAFTLPDTFHLDFPVLVETAIISHDLQINLPIRKDHFLLLREEYTFVKHKLEINSFSYNLLDIDGNSIVRADNLPYHHKDYKGHKLTNPPNHLHDKQGRICSFSGDIEDFFEIISKYI